MNESLIFTSSKKRKYSDLNDIYDKSVKFCRDSTSRRYTINENYNKLNETNKNSKNLLFNNNIYITPIKKSKRENSLTESEGIYLNNKMRKISLSCCKDLNSVIFSCKFKARKCPSFTYTHIRMSDKPLTIPESPRLQTKLRSYRKLK
jgi:hypothetical protein